VNRLRCRLLASDVKDFARGSACRVAIIIHLLSQPSTGWLTASGMPRQWGEKARDLVSCSHTTLPQMLNSLRLTAAENPPRMEVESRMFALPQLTVVELDTQPGGQAPGL
jgi:hypothetical protein